MKPRLGSAPIFVQVLALVLLSLVAAQAVNLAVVLTLPDPPPLGLTAGEAARALKGETVTTRDGKRLVAVLRDAPPVSRVDGHVRGLEGMLSGGVAQNLGVDPDRVRVAIDPDGVKMRHAVRNVVIRRHAARRAEFLVRVAPDPAGDPVAGPPPPPPSRALGTFDTADHAVSLGENFVFPPFTAALRTPDGRWLTVAPERPWLSPWQTRLLVWFALSALLLTPLAWVVARRLARPIHSFAAAAERLGADPNAPPLVQAGPAEVRTAVAAFNDMQEKLRGYVQERTSMVAAIAHDLRTPLTRLRFRAEAAPDEVRDKMAADIEQMDGMVRSALAFVRGETLSAEHVRLDLTSLVASVVDDLAEMGADVAFETATPVVVSGDPLALKRLVTNLTDNAVKFGGRARLSLELAGATATLLVEDDGPGLPNSELDRVFEPFYRPDPSRSSDAGGVGLGLSVARSIARAHGGEITLANRPEGGLRAIVRLPL
jgi:signal transduction histidine kinase